MAHISLFQFKRIFDLLQRHCECLGWRWVFIGIDKESMHPGEHRIDLFPERNNMYVQGTGMHIYSYMYIQNKTKYNEDCLRHNNFEGGAV
jgi:hypothetical protein